MYTLGINAAYHDPAACLVRDGARRSRRRRRSGSPTSSTASGRCRSRPGSCRSTRSTTACARPGSRLAEVDHVAYSYDPYLLLGRHRDDATITLPLEPSAHPTPEEWESAWDPLFLSSIVNAPRPAARRRPAPPAGAVPRRPRPTARSAGTSCAHHLAHAASAFHASPFERAAVMTLDGRGEKATTGYAVGQGTDLEWLGQVHMPHSLGMLYEQVTELPRLPALVRRVQGDGPGLVRQAALRRRVPRDRPARRGRPVHDRRRSGWRSGSARPGRAAGRSSSGTSTSPTRSRSCWKRRCWSWPAGCTRRRAATTSAWPAAWP